MKKKVRKPIPGKTKTKKGLCPTDDMYGYIFEIRLGKMLGKMLLRDGNRDRSGDKCPNQDTLRH